ncbi:hypothetical protein [Fervidicella metallireducens]|uniref:hypothetical protein n=1 Tax=Fervidicella metallireducens TaxID=655338 RepID=UPI000684F886|nr:hypothetical protein [Fervidicella metallireducens]
MDFGQYWDIDLLRKNKEPIVRIIKEISDCYKVYFEYLKKGKSIHDLWEKEYLKGMDFNKADKITQEIISKTIVGKLNKEGKEVHRFSGALTPQGQICFYEELTDGIINRYVVKGRPGTGKSTMNKKIAKAALEAGFDVEYYHCAFEPASIDMIIIPELDFAILDGTAPHVFDPDGDDILVDMFTCIDTNIVHEEDNPIKQITEDYASELKKAKDVYKKIKDLHDELEKYYIAATDFNEVNALRIRIENELKNLR